MARQRRSPAPRRAAVSSYGFSGTNVHAILEQAPEPVAPSTRARPTPAIDGAAAFPAVGHARPTHCAKPPAGWPTGCDAHGAELAR